MYINVNIFVPPFSYASNLFNFFYLFHLVNFSHDFILFFSVRSKSSWNEWIEKKKFDRLFWIFVLQIGNKSKLYKSFFKCKIIFKIFFFCLVKFKVIKEKFV